MRDAAVVGRGFIRGRPVVVGITDFAFMAGSMGSVVGEKLTLAACRDVDAAFASASWGKFQVMGAHWKALGYDSPLALAWSCVGSEAAHYELLARYIEHNNLAGAFRAISADLETCRAFADGYNGPGYRKFDYHSKIAARMK